MIITSENYVTEVENHNGIVILDFFAEWCGPCRMLSPVLEELAESRPGVKICKVNVDEEPELAAKFNIVSIPTLIFFKDGKAVGTSIGYMEKDELEKKIALYE